MAKVFPVRFWLLCAGVLLASCTGCLSKPTGPAHETPSRGPAEDYERSDPWVLVDSAQDRMVVYKKGSAPLIFQNIAVGAAGVKEKIRRGDDVTPRGVYRVAWIRNQSKFSRFIGLNYPSRVDAQRGLEAGRIDRQLYERILRAHVLGEVPPQDTPLGGFIGIHGVGRGSLEVHRLANWTGGCIALENNQIHLLSELVTIGTIVEIR